MKTITFEAVAPNKFQVTLDGKIISHKEYQQLVTAGKLNREDLQLVISEADFAILKASSWEHAS